MNGQASDSGNPVGEESESEASDLESRLSKIAKHLSSGQVAIILPFLGAAIFLCRCLGATHQDIRQAQILFSVSASFAASAGFCCVSLVCGLLSEWRFPPVALVPLIFVSLFFVSEVVKSDRMWVPRERLVVGATTSSGYVIEVSEDHFYVLFDGTRDVSLVPKSDITSRKLCPAQC